MHLESIVPRGALLAGLIAAIAGGYPLPTGR